MNIKDALLHFCKENIKNLSAMYNWGINLKDLPISLTLKSENLYTQNIELRFQLNNAYLNSNTSKEKYALLQWYISNWGSVKTNKTKTLELYNTCSPQELIERGAKGIASWSKALSIVNPIEYAIYDARVAMSLNALQIIHQVENPYFYPRLSNRNNMIKDSQKQMQSTTKQWNKFKKQEFYLSYLNLLKEVANDFQDETHHHDIEMLLFAYAEKLALSAVQHLNHQK